MKRLAALYIVFSLIQCFSGEEMPDYREVFPRALVSSGDQKRIQAFFRKAEAGENLTVGVLGGSITRGASASGEKKCYPGVLLNWLRGRFPQAKFRLVNAGIGSTGSDYGVLRIERDLFRYNPDLVILEFGVNDKTENLAETYEGCVRQILAFRNKPALIILFMMWKNGSNAQDWQVPIGAHYRIPMVSYRDALLPELLSGRISWRFLSSDIVHPNDRGHLFAGNLLIRLLECSLRNSHDSKQEKTVHVQQDILPPPLVSDQFDQCVLLEEQTLKPSCNQGWEFQPAEGEVPPGWNSSEPGSAIEFEVPGEVLLFSYWRTQKQPMGKAKVLIDGKETFVADGWFHENWGGKRWVVRFPKKLPDGKHRVRIELLKESNPKSLGHSFRILCLGGAGKGVSK